MPANEKRDSALPWQPWPPLLQIPVMSHTHTNASVTAVVKHALCEQALNGKRIAKKNRDSQGDEESSQEYKEVRSNMKRKVTKAKEKAHGDPYEKLVPEEG
ncbi:hypothetical protein SK128_014812, partial [Halocaridina rubra]